MTIFRLEKLQGKKHPKSIKISMNLFFIGYFQCFGSNLNCLLIFCFLLYMLKMCDSRRIVELSVNWEYSSYFPISLNGAYQLFKCAICANFLAHFSLKRSVVQSCEYFGLIKSNLKVDNPECDFWSYLPSVISLLVTNVMFVYLHLRLQGVTWNKHVWTSYIWAYCKILC